MILATSSLFVCLEFIGRHPGLLLVLIGVAGEIFCDWKEMGVGRLARAKKFSAILLVVGLMMEFWEAAKYDNEVANTEARTALIESNSIALSLQVAELNKEAADARVIAGNAQRDAGQANERAAKFDADRALIAREAEEIRGTNFVLQARVLELEAKNQDRTITEKQFDAFISALVKTPEKSSVMIGVRHPGGETVRYETKICRLLESVGFELKSIANYPDNLAVFNQNSGIGILVDNLNDAPPCATNLFNAFTVAGMNPTLITNIPDRYYSPAEGHPGSNQVLVLIGEKP